MCVLHMPQGMTIGWNLTLTSLIILKFPSITEVPQGESQPASGYVKAESQGLTLGKIPALNMETILYNSFRKQHKAFSKHRLVIVDSMICIYMLLLLKGIYVMSGYIGIIVHYNLRHTKLLLAVRWDSWYWFTHKIIFFYSTLNFEMHFPSNCNCDFYS